MKKIIPLLLLFNIYAININDTNYNTDTRSFENISEVNTLGNNKLLFSLSGNFNGDPYYNDRDISRSQNLELKAQYGFLENLDFGIGIGVNQLEENLVKSTQLRDIILDSKIHIFDRLSLIPQIIIPIGNNNLVNNKSITYGGKIAYDIELGEQIFYQNIGYLISSGNQYNQINQNSQLFASLGHKLNINKIVYLGNEVIYYSNESENLIGFQPHFNISNGNFNIRAGLEFYNKRRENGAFVTLNLPFDRLLDQAPIMFQNNNAPEIPFQFTYKQAKEEKEKKERIDEKALKEKLKKELKKELKEELLKEVKEEVESKKKLKEMKGKQEKVYNIQRRLDDSIEVLKKYYDLYINNQIADKDAQREIRWGLRVVKLRRKYLNKLVNNYKENNYKEKLEQLGNYKVPKKVEKLAKKVLKELSHKNTDNNIKDSSVVQITNSKKNTFKKNKIQPLNKKTNIIIQKNSENIAKEQRKIWEKLKNRKPIKNDLSIKENRKYFNKKKEKSPKPSVNQTVQNVRVEKVMIPKIKKIDLQSEIKPIKIDINKEKNLFKQFFEKTKTKLEKQNNGLAKELNKFYNQYKAKIQVNKDKSTTVKTKKATVTFIDNEKEKTQEMSNQPINIEEKESLSNKLEEVYKDYEIISIQESQDDIVPEDSVGEDAFIQKNTGPQF